MKPLRRIGTVIKHEGRWYAHHDGELEPLFWEYTFREISSRLREMECGDIRIVYHCPGVWIVWSR